MTQLTTAEAFLAQVKDNCKLQTDAVRIEVKAVLALIRELDSILDELTSLPVQPSQSNVDGNPYNKQLNLNVIHGQFDKALQQAF